MEHAQGSRTRYRTAVITTVVLIVVCGALLPFARRSFPAVPGVPPVFITFSLCLAAISAFVISTQYRSSRSRALLVLASAYAFIALMAIPELSIALARSAGFNLAPGAPGILALLAQAGFDFHVCWYIYASTRKDTVPVKGAEFVSRVFSMRLLLVALIATTLAFGPWRIAPMVDIGASSALDGVALAATIATLLYRRSDSLLCSWLGVALVASFLGELFTAASGARFTLGWYVASTLHLVEYGVILGAFVKEVSIHSGELETLATIDPLTGLANRRHLDAYLDRLLSDGRRATDTLSLLMIDIDHFKRFNDRFGHAAGDIALQTVAKALKQTVGRSQDFAARYGGEEFVVLLTGIDRLGALDVAERLRAHIENMLIAHENGAQRVTISTGIVSIRSRDQLDPAALLREADRALYTAKALGRNQVHENRVFPKTLRRTTEDVATA
jgi:diguanylate cyclase (GGDEF)-like protein